MNDTKTNHDLHGEILALTEGITPKLIEIRREIHANPELGFEEYETSRLVKETLVAFGATVIGEFAKTGVATLIGNGTKRTVAVRGDMDALPIHQMSTPKYASKNPGKMHACGHDAHTAIALGVAFVLSKLRDKMDGKAMVIFQPAEEGLGGARAMIEDGILEWGKPDVILGYHNWPLLDGGTIGWHPHIAFASEDSFDIEIRGLSGHGAHPHLAIDPIVAAGNLVTALQSIISREVAPLETGVISIGRVEGGTIRNQIPDKVTLQGSTRSHDPKARSTIKEAIKRVCNGVGQINRVTCEVRFHEGQDAVVNDRDILLIVRQEAEAMVGADHVVELPQGSMGSEDFSEFSTRIRSAHLRIGSRFPSHNTMLHRSDFDLDEVCIPIAVKTLSAATMNLMDSNVRPAATG